MKRILAEHKPTRVYAVQFRPDLDPPQIPAGVKKDEEKANSWYFYSRSKGRQEIVAGDYIIELLGEHLPQGGMRESGLPDEMRFWVCAKQVFEGGYRVVDEQVVPDPDISEKT